MSWTHPLGPTMIPSWFPNFPAESKLKRKPCTQRISVNNSRNRHPPRKYGRAPDTWLIFLRKASQDANCLSLVDCLRILEPTKCGKTSSQELSFDL